MFTKAIELATTKTTVTTSTENKVEIPPQKE